MISFMSNSSGMGGVKTYSQQKPEGKLSFSLSPSSLKWMEIKKLQNSRGCEEMK